MDRAIAGHDVPGFFNACRTSAQERLGEVWCQTPESITLAEVKDRLSKNAAGVRYLFEKRRCSRLLWANLQPGGIETVQGLGDKRVEEFEKYGGPRK